MFINVMVLFDDANADNGCFRVIDESRKAGSFPGCEDGRQLQGFYTHPDCVDETAQVLIEASAGSAIFFDPHIVHGSGLTRAISQGARLSLPISPQALRRLKAGKCGRFVEALKPDL